MAFQAVYDKIELQNISYDGISVTHKINSWLQQTVHLLVSLLPSVLNGQFIHLSYEFVSLSFEFFFAILYCTVINSVVITLYPSCHNGANLQRSTTPHNQYRSIHIT